MKNRMGAFYTSCRVENHIDRKKSVEVPKLLVDTAAEFTWIKADTLKKVGVTREKKSYTFITATDEEINRTIGFAIIRVGDAVTIDEVVFAEPDDLELLGARSLEGLNLRVDSRAKKLVAGGPILAAAQKLIYAQSKPKIAFSPESEAID
jgi:predicted aspartyl protease